MFTNLSLSVSHQKTIVLLIILVNACVQLQAQSLNANWKLDLATSMQQFQECQNGNKASIDCNAFTGKSLNTIYKVNDFYSEKAGRYMTVNEIDKFLKDSQNWTELGKTYDQKTLDIAQEFANAKKAVVALYQNSEGIGHVVVIIPGSLQLSGSWGLNVPSAASFFTVDPSKSFTNKALSFAFSKSMMKDVTIFARNY